jgi:aryl-alcohol dehydrogenase-like predicted oxidoreductase
MMTYLPCQCSVSDGQRVSAMSLGTVQLGMNYGIANTEGKPDRTKSHAILRAALEQGITALDTARGYGEAEDVLGSFLAAVPEAAGKTFITTKLASGLPPGAAAAEVEAVLYRSVETSLSKLGMEKVNCLLLHNAADMTVHGRVTAGVLRSLVKEGRTGMAGVSVYQPEEAVAMLEEDVYQAIQIPMNVFDQRFLYSGALEALRKKGVKIFVRSVFFQGLFFLDPDTVTDPDLVSYAVPHIRTLRRLAEKAGMSVAQFAVAFIRDLPGITSLVLGADNPGQVIENSALFETPPLDESLLREAEKSFREINYKGIMSVLSRPKQ